MNEEDKRVIDFRENMFIEMKEKFIFEQAKEYACDYADKALKM